MVTEQIPAQFVTLKAPRTAVAVSATGAVGLIQVHLTLSVMLAVVGATNTTVPYVDSTAHILSETKGFPAGSRILTMLPLSLPRPV